MEKKNLLTKILAIAGTTLVWLPILAPLFFGFLSLIADGIFRFDFLMPAELFPLILAGWALLIWAAIRARKRLKLIAWGAGTAAALIFVGQGLAVVTGLASGAAEPEGWRMTLVIGAIALFIAAVIVTGIGGILLLRDLFTPAPPTASNN